MHISGGDAQNIVNEMKAAVHHDINIMDEEGRILASTNPARVGQLHSGAVRLLREGLPSLVVYASDPEKGVQQGVNLPVVIDGRTEGVIGITGDPEVVGVFGDVIKRMTEIMMERTLRQEQQAEEERARGIFLETWLFDEAADPEELRRRGALLGMDPAFPYTLAILEPQTGGTDRDARLSDQLVRTVNRHLRSEHQSFCVMLHGQIFILLCSASRQGAFTQAVEICNDLRGRFSLPCRVGISSASTSVTDIRRCYLEARTAVRVARRSDRHTIVFYDQVSLEFITESVPAAIRRDLRKMLFGSCTPRETEEFTETIRLYFELDGDIAACAEKLYIHRNTFTYRMDQLARKTGCHLKRPRDSLLLYLAVS